jgi:hypothetical protein
LRISLSSVVDFWNIFEWEVVIVRGEGILIRD